MKIELEEGELAESDEEEDVVTEKTNLQTNGLKKLSGAVLQLGFMRRSLNRLTSIERKNQKKVEDPCRVYPTVLSSNDDPVP